MIYAAMLNGLFSCRVTVCTVAAMRGLWWGERSVWRGDKVGGVAAWFYGSAQHESLLIDVR